MRILASYDDAFKKALEIKRKNKNAFIEKPRKTSFGFPNGTSLELNVIEVYYESYDPVDGWVDNMAQIFYK